MIAVQRVTFTSNEDGTCTAVTGSGVAVTCGLYQLLAVDVDRALADADQATPDVIEYRHADGHLLIRVVKDALLPPSLPVRDDDALHLGMRRNWQEDMFRWLLERTAADTPGMRSVVDYHSPERASGNCVTCERALCPTLYNLVRHYLHEAAT